jgi:hypothetical protein
MMRFHGAPGYCLSDGIYSRAFEVLYTDIRVKPTELLISDDWTHALYVGMRKRQSVCTR